MNEANKKKIWKKIIETGDYLKNKLPESENHPKGRNSYAHVCLEIKSKFKKSYKDIDDNQIDNLINFMNYLKKNPY